MSDIIRTTLGPRSMLKMLLDPMGGIVMTNDGNSILREVDVSHPAAKSMIELSRAQDEEVGDGTTSVIILSKFAFTFIYASLSIVVKRISIIFHNVFNGNGVVVAYIMSCICVCRWRDAVDCGAVAGEELSPYSYRLRLHESPANCSGYLQ